MVPNPSWRNRSGSLLDIGREVDDVDARNPPMWVMVLLAGGPVAAGIEAAASRAGAGGPAKGKQNYMDFCVPCHGMSGKGDGPMAATLPAVPRNHTDGAYMNALPEAHLFRVIKEGGAAVVGSPSLRAHWRRRFSSDGL